MTSTETSQTKPSAQDTDRQTPDFVEALARGLRVLESFDAERRKMTLTEVARHTGLSRGTARRLLLTLRDLNYVHYGDKQFWLSPAVLKLGQSYVASLGLGEEAAGIVRALSLRLGESCSVAVLDGSDVVYVARGEIQRLYSSHVAVGSRVPAFASSLGRVLLAAMPPAQFEEWLAQNPPYSITERTVSDADALRSIVEGVRTKGYAIIDGELEIGIRSIAVPLMSNDGVVRAALNTGAVAERVPRRQLETAFLKELRAVAITLSKYFP